MTADYILGWLWINQVVPPKAWAAGHRPKANGPQVLWFLSFSRMITPVFEHSLYQSSVITVSDQHIISLLVTSGYAQALQVPEQGAKGRGLSMMVQILKIFLHSFPPC